MKKIFILFVILFILAFVSADTPSVNFSSQNPNDINTLNVIGTPLWINYTISAEGLDNDSIYFYYKANSTVSDVQYYQNGTAHSGYFSQIYTSNITTNFGWRLYDNSIYKGTYNFGEISLENYGHTLNQTTAVPEYYKIEFLNISNTSTYGIFEIMANATASAKPLRIYYCNSSYGSGNVNGSAFCVLFGTLTSQTTFNHTHTAYSSHQAIPFAINATAQTLSGVKVTEKSYFVVGGAGSWQIWNINNFSRTGAIARTGNSGIAWTNQTFTIDSHVHQYNATDSFYYYVCANDTLDNQNCTSVRSDLMELGGLPPTSVSITSPTNSTYSREIQINYTEAFSPNGYNITYYNISLLDIYDNYQAINTNNSINLGYIWNSSLLNGRWYVVRVEAFDNMSQNSTSYSEAFVIDNINPTFSTVPDNASLFYGNDSLSVTFTESETNYDSCSVNDTVNFTITKSGLSHVLTNASPLAVGNYEINVTINDTANNINWTIYKIQVNKSMNYDCGIYFSTTSPVTYPINFSVFTNCTSTYTIYQNGSAIVNYTNVTGGVGYYNLTVQRTDITNYTNTVNSRFFTVNPNTEICKVLYNQTSPINAQYTLLAWANCSSAFVLAKNGSTIANNSEQTLAEGAYNFTFTRNDTVNYSNNYNESEFRILAADSTPPTFTTIPANTSLFYGNQSVSLTFLGADTGLWGYYSINDTTKFAITSFSNGTGVLKNTTPIAVGNYAINVTINDSANNINWTIYRLKINKSNEDCKVLFSETSPVYVGETFRVWANCSTAFTLYRNGTAVDNYSSQSISTGAYNFSLERTDSSNFSIYFNQSEFRVISSSSSSDSTGSGSSGGNPNAAKTYLAYDNYFSTGDSFDNMKPLDKITFEVNETNHILTLNTFNATAARITIRSSVIVAYLSEGELKEFDIDEDFVNDIRVKYTFVNTSRASIFIQSLFSAPFDEIINDTGTNESLGNDTLGNLTMGPQQEGNKTGIFSSMTKKTKSVLAIILVFAIILGIFLFFVIRKKIKEQRNLEVKQRY